MDNPKKLFSWLIVGQEKAAFRLLDLLEITQDKDHVDEVVALVYDIISELTIKVETEKALVEHIVLPTYRKIGEIRGEIKALGPDF